MENKTAWDFSKAVVAPLEKLVGIDVDLSEKLLARLHELADRTNRSVSAVIVHILTDMLAAQLDFACVSADSLLKAAKESPVILLLENGKPIARVEMLDKETCGLPVEQEKKKPLAKGAAHAELSADCDRLVCRAESDYASAVSAEEHKSA